MADEVSLKVARTGESAIKSAREMCQAAEALCAALDTYGVVAHPGEGYIRMSVATGEKLLAYMRKIMEADRA